MIANRAYLLQQVSVNETKNNTIIKADLPKKINVFP